ALSHPARKGPQDDGRHGEARRADERDVGLGVAGARGEEGSGAVARRGEGGAREDALHGGRGPRRDREGKGAPRGEGARPPLSSTLGFGTRKRALRPNPSAPQRETCLFVWPQRGPTLRGGGPLWG